MRVGSTTISPSCDLVEVYLVDGLKHNLLSISQLGEQVLMFISTL